MTTMKIFVDDELIKEEEVFSAENWDEIPDKVKENIFSKHGNISVDYEWYEFVIDDAESVGIKIKEFDTYQTVKRYDLRRKDFSEQQFERELLEDYLTLLRKEYEFLTSEESVIETF